MYHARATVEKLTGLNGRTIQSWVNQGIVKPAVMARGKGGKRRYSDYNVYQMIIVNHFTKEYGLPLSFSRIALTLLHPILFEISRWTLNIERIPREKRRA